jgi:hypothetical protein
MYWHHKDAQSKNVNPESMKYNKIVNVLLTGLLAGSASFTAQSQLNCDGVTSMYGLFIDQARTSERAYLAPINYTTGAPGAAMAPGIFNVPRAGTSGSGNTAYGTTSLAADLATNRMYYMTADYNSKDIWAANAITGTKTKIADALPTALNGFYFVKMAVAPDGYVYSLSTDRAYAGTPRTKLIRFRSCGTANCATTAPNSIEILADIPFSSFDANVLYNGDMAFDVYGNMYIFGSEIDPSIGSYVKAGLFRINVGDIPTSAPAVPGIIPITRIGDVPALDALVISGFALDGAGNFYLATVDQTTRAESSIFQGSVIGATMTVNLLWRATIAGYIISDLASCSYPMMTILDASAPKLNALNRGEAVSLFWKPEGLRNIRSFVLERKLEGAREFARLTTIPYNSAASEYSYSDETASQTPGNHHYRIRFMKEDGSSTVSNTVDISFEERLKTKILVTGNPFYSALSFELTTVKPGLKTVTIYDNAGHPVMTEKVSVTTGINKIRIEKTASLRKGIYILHVGDDADHQQYKIIKQ